MDIFLGNEKSKERDLGIDAVNEITSIAPREFTSMGEMLWSESGNIRAPHISII
jgi:hypothetical protein